jgi:nucleosome binding factor SPN SPT16 subunit
MAYYDEKKQSLLVPFNLGGHKYMIPFHLHMIKNAAMNLEKNVAYLRVNFHTPL